MKFVISLIYLFVYISMCSTAAMLSISEHPDYPGKCYDYVYGIGPLSWGQEINDPKKCLHLMCRNGSWLESYSCGVYGVPPGCELSKPIVAAYPKCCHREIICNNVMENN
ncbi:U-scoloptoxin(16)-Er9a-like [Musca autumnalis]|uniref:U-scoloptoxin(16)-Er9a-like n=1 Tax=Musca autumnalis TaxID=221902 RepID=UPI003CF26C8A